jgi:hypothetical protein
MGVSRWFLFWFFDPAVVAESATDSLEATADDRHFIAGRKIVNRLGEAPPPAGRDRAGRGGNRAAAVLFFPGSGC